MTLLTHPNPDLSLCEDHRPRWNPARIEDVTPEMVVAATALAAQRNLSNVEFRVGNIRGVFEIANPDNPDITVEGLKVHETATVLNLAEFGRGQPLTGVAQMQTLGDGVWCARRSDGGVVCVLPFQMPAEGATPGPAPTPATRMDGDVPLGGAIDLVGRCIRRAGLPLRCWSESDGSVADYPPLPLGAGNVVTLGGDSYYGTCVLADTAMAWCGRDDGSFGPLGG